MESLVPIYTAALLAVLAALGGGAAWVVAQFRDAARLQRLHETDLAERYTRVILAVAHSLDEFAGTQRELAVLIRELAKHVQHLGTMPEVRRGGGD